MIGCLLGRDARVAVVLRMGRRKVAATKVVVVFLLAVIGERLATQLPAADAATVGKRGEEECVDPGHLLEAVQHLVGAFVHERHGSYLNPDHRRLGGCRAAGCPAEDGASRDERGRLQEHAAIHVSLPQSLYVSFARSYASARAMRRASSISTTCRATSRARKFASTRRARSCRAGMEQKARVSSLKPALL